MNRIELCYSIFSVFDSAFNILICSYFCMVWTRPFLDHKRKAWITGGAYAATMLVLDFMPWYINPMLAYMTGTLAVFFVMCVTDRIYFTQKFFIAITFFCLRWQAPRIVVYINNEIDGAIYRFLSPENDIFWFFWYVFVTFIGYNLFMFLLLYGAVKSILWSYGRGREHMDGREFLLLIMPPLSGVVSYGVIRYYDYIYKRDTGKSIYTLYGSHDLIMLLFTLLSFAVILVTTYVFRLWKTKQEEDRQREIFSTQMVDLQNHISETERLYRDLRSLRHDMGNHLMTLEQLYSKGEYETAEQYAGTLRTKIQDISGDISSGNPVTDVILSGRKKEMEEKDIHFSCDFHYPVTDAVNSFDISIILNNALSNAIEAVEREKTDSHKKTYVSLSSNRRKNMYIIVVANTFSKTLKTDPTSGLPPTTKSEEGHGFGLAGIRHVARKYLGDIEIRKEIFEGKEQCVLRVMLQIPVT